MTISDLTGGRSFRELLPFVLGGLLLIVVINIGVLLFVNSPRLAEAENADQTTAALGARVERTEPFRSLPQSSNASIRRRARKPR